MKVTDIKQQSKTAGRYSIFIDGKFSFGLSENALLDSGIRIGKEYSKQELKDLQDSAKSDKAYNRTLGLIARRQRSEWEVRDYLKRKEYESELIDQIVQRLYANRWLDDEAFARMWVENRRLLKSSSTRRLQQELKAKRVPDDVIKNVLAEDATDEQQLLKDLIDKKRRQTRYQDPQKLMAYLIRQGFNYSDIKEALRETEE
jgi:regulatory protein